MIIYLLFLCLLTSTALLNESDEGPWNLPVIPINLDELLNLGSNKYSKPVDKLIPRNLW